MKITNSLNKLIIIGWAAIVSGCNSSDGAQSSDEEQCPLLGSQTTNELLQTSVELNPHGIAPLTALIELAITSPATVRLTVKGKHGSESDVVQNFSQCEAEHTIPVLGLYANHMNEVEVEVLNNGVVMSRESLTMNTGLLPDEFPSLEVVKDYESPDTAFFLVNFVNFLATNRPLIVDRYGEIRWYLNVQGAKFGLQILRNGNIAFGLEVESRIEEYSLLGEALNTWSILPEFEAIHHDVYEMESGNFLVSVNKVGIDTIEDFIIEVDRSTSDVVTVWDLREILPRRFTFIRDELDWFHTNAVIHDARDDSIIISGQRQGVVKVSRDNELRWILAPPEGWNGFEEYLLTMPASGDFEWNWGQHSPLILPNGDLLLFDNGFGREYGSGGLYSRAVQYRINENEDRGGTVQQIWQYGKERGPEMYSPIISDVDFLPEQENVLITTGSLAFEATYVSADDIRAQWIEEPEKARIIEVDSDGTVIFEMLVTSQIIMGSVYRSEKIALYRSE